MSGRQFSLSSFPSCVSTAPVSDNEVSSLSDDESLVDAASALLPHTDQWCKLSQNLAATFASFNDSCKKPAVTHTDDMSCWLSIGKRLSLRLSSLQDEVDVDAEVQCVSCADSKPPWHIVGLRLAAVMRAAVDELEDGRC